jgi:hypothetical protein
MAQHRSFPRSGLKAFVVLMGAGIGMATAADIQTVDEGGLGKHWSAAPGATFPAPGYPASMKDSGATVCVSIAYTVDKDGVPGELMLVDTWSRDSNEKPLFDDKLEPFVQSAAGALQSWRFTPRDGGKAVPLRTSATMIFRSDATVPANQVVAHCKTQNLEARLSKRRGNRMNEATRLYLTQNQAMGSDRARQEAEAAAAARAAARNPQ